VNFEQAAAVCGILKTCQRNLFWLDDIVRNFVKCEMDR